MSAENISSIKPDDRTFARPDPNLEWNNKTEEAYIKKGYTLERHKFSQEHKFLSIVDIRKGAIQKQVTKIVRIKALDYDIDTSSYKKERKEYIYYFENWYGNDWRGAPIAPVADHLEGVYQDPLDKIVYSKAGEPIQKELTGFHNDVYYIEFSKKKVDEIIKNSIQVTQEPIKYVVKFGKEDAPFGQLTAPVRGEFSYEQFANWTFQDLYKLQTKPRTNNDPNIGTTQRTLYK